MTPFEVLFGVKMKHKEDIDILNIIEQESVELFNENRYDLRITARENIQKIQEENRRTASKITKLAQLYKEGDIVAIKRTQFGTGLKISPKIYGPYKVTKVKRNNRYDVIKVGQGEGPERTSTAADLMKPYPVHSSGTEDWSGWPNAGSLDGVDGARSLEGGVRHGEETKD